MKYYGKIGEFRKLNIQIFKNDELIYEGEVEDAPDEIKELEYYECHLGNPTIFKV